MGFLFGDKPKLKFKQSPEQKWLWGNVTQPLWQNMMGGNMPSLYGLPDPNMLLPTGDWWSGMDPMLKAGIMQPFQEGSQQLMESMGARGQLGGATTPYSGSASVGQGQYWADVMPQAAMTGWGMTAPGRQMQYTSELNRNIAGYNQQMMPYTMLPGVTGQSMSYPVVTPGSQGIFPGLMQLGGMALGGYLGGGFGAMMGGQMGGQTGQMIQGQVSPQGNPYVASNTPGMGMYPSYGAGNSYGLPGYYGEWGNPYYGAPY